MKKNNFSFLSFKAKEPQYVAYYRVSTKQQGLSGLGLDAQRRLVESFVKCQDCIVAEFTDIDSGKNNERTELLKAIDKAKSIGAKLVIAKLDRLSRNAGFIFALKDSKVEFVCADMPEANNLTISIFAALAQHERETISERTKKALAEKKAQGYKLGTPANLTEAARKKGQAARKRKAKENPQNKQALKIIVSERGKGMAYNKIADELNSLGMRTRTGKLFSSKGVYQLYKASMQ